MKITFTTSPENFEFANYILAQAIKQLEDHPELLKQMDLTDRQLKKADTFRRSLVRGFTDAAKVGGKGR